MASGGTMIRTQHFDPPKDAPKYLLDGLKDIGLQEWVMKNGQKVSNPVVQRYVAKAMQCKPGTEEEQRWLKTNTRTTPWCAYWINAKLEFAGIPGTASGMARSFLKWGDKVWKKGEPWPVSIPVGSIGVMWRGSHDDGVTGHVFQYLWSDKNYVYGLGGNQGDSVSIQRFAKSKMLGFRKPRPIVDSKTVQSGGGLVGNETIVKPVIESIPDAPANTSGGVEGMIDALRGATSPLEALAAVKPALQLIASAITIGIAAYIIYLRYKAWKAGQ